MREVNMRRIGPNRVGRLLGGWGVSWGVSLHSAHQQVATNLHKEMSRNGIKTWPKVSDERIHLDEVLLLHDIDVVDRKEARPAA